MKDLLIVNKEFMRIKYNNEEACLYDHKEIFLYLTHKDADMVKVYNILDLVYSSDYINVELAREMSKILLNEL